MMAPRAGAIQVTNSSPLRRSRGNCVIAGVLGGLAQHLGLDPRGLRIAYVLLSILSAAFPGILIYLILWVLIPQED